MSPGAVFADTNVFAYALDTADPGKQRRAQEVIAEHRRDLMVSTQVLIELRAVCTRKLGMSQVSIFDAGIIGAASRAGCTTLLTEDLNAGRTYGDVVVVDPFA